MNRTVSLPEDLANAIEAKVTAGQYGSSGDVVRDALYLLDQRDCGNETEPKSHRAAGQADLGSKDAGDTDYATLKQPFRRAIRAGELSDVEVALIAKSEVPAEHAQLDEELKDWHP